MSEEYRPMRDYAQEEIVLAERRDSVLQQIEARAQKDLQRAKDEYDAERIRLLEGRLISWSNMNQRQLQSALTKFSEKAEAIKARAKHLTTKAIETYNRQREDLLRDKKTDARTAAISTDQISKVIARVDKDSALTPEERIKLELDAKEAEYFGKKGGDASQKEEPYN